jgi:hypothetical protein
MFSDGVVAAVCMFSVSKGMERAERSEELLIKGSKRKVSYGV